MHVHLVLLLNAERFQVFHHQPDQFALQDKKKHYLQYMHYVHTLRWDSCSTPTPLACIPQE